MSRVRGVVTATATPTSRDAKEAFLRTARIADVRGVTVGITGIRRATLETGSARRGGLYEGLPTRD